MKVVKPAFTYDEKELLRQVAKGNEKAFRLVFDTYRDALYFYLLRITSSKEIAEDILQDSFLKIWLLRERLTTVEHFRAYLFRMARNDVMNVLRRKALEADILKDTGEGNLPAIKPDEHLHVKQVREVLRNAVESLPPQQKRVYQLRREEGHPIREIALMMDISDVTVKRHLTQAQKTIRQAFEQSFPYQAGMILMILGLLR